MIDNKPTIHSDRRLAIKRAAAEAEDKMHRLYELCGSGADLNMTVDSFLAMTREDETPRDEEKRSE
ncbi:MAG: hypothetical protein FWG72_03450 [Oscillospiraceae bacterium]|nr:hypothetical protein [Oscillospiraceae bacterium]